MQQPRQNYGLGSFVKKITRKVTKPFTKVASKIVPKEIAGIMRTAAPFLPPGYREAAYLLGTAKQTGRISPMDLALTALPTISRSSASGRLAGTRFGEGVQNIKDTIGGMKIPFTDRSSDIIGNQNKTFKELLVGQEYFNPENNTEGFFGKGGKMFQIGKGTLPGTGSKQNFGIFNTKAGQKLFGTYNKKTGAYGPSLSKLAGIGIGLFDLISAAKTPKEAGEIYAETTGQDAIDGENLFNAIDPRIFAIPDQFVLKQNAANGGRIGLRFGGDTMGGINDRSRSSTGVGGQSPGPRGQRGGSNTSSPGGNNNSGGERENDGSNYRNRTVNSLVDTRDNRQTLKEIAKGAAKNTAKNFAINKGLNILGLSQYANPIGILLGLKGLIQKNNSPLNIENNIKFLDDEEEFTDGGLMRTNYAMGSEDMGVVNPFQPKPIGPALPEEDKPYTPKPTPKMAGIPKGLDLEKAKEMFIEFNGREPIDMQELLEFFNVKQQAAGGGLMRNNYALGSMPTDQESGLGGLPIEADMRYTGGFMPYGEVEKADDVPARLSKNEFVFTADAVRAAGGGSVQKGAKKMYDTMKKLEQQPEAKGAMA